MVKPMVIFGLIIVIVVIGIFVWKGSTFLNAENQTNNVNTASQSQGGQIGGFDGTKTTRGKVGGLA